MSGFPLGGDRINPSPCSPEDLERFYQEVADTLNDGGAGTDEKFAAADGTTAGYWEDIVTGESTYVEGTHTQVFWERTGSTLMLFSVAGGEGGGDTYQVKVDSGGTPGFLDTKIHADSWEPTSTFNSGTHFVVLATPISDAVKFYAPYNIIKTSAGDGSPGYLAAKCANASTYNATNHILAYSEDQGSTMRFFVAKSDITALVGDTTVGNVRLCKVPYGAVSVATVDGSGNVSPGSCVGLVELNWNAGSVRFEPGDTIATGTVFWPKLTPMYLLADRWKIGLITPMEEDPAKYILHDVDCYSTAEAE